MKKKNSAVIGMAVVYFMMMTTMAWAGFLNTGTVNDGYLVWLQNADCFSGLNWSEAMSKAASLKTGMCGLTDNSTAGQWRLPTKDELLRRKTNLNGFYSVQADVYWSSTPQGEKYMWFVHMANGNANFRDKSNKGYVWPVRSR